MALSSDTVWELRTGGSTFNGGGFVTGASGTDHSLQDAAQYSVSDGVTAGTTTITSATAAFGTDVVGNIMYVTGGTGSVAVGRYQIMTRVSATEITVDRSTGLTAGTGVTLIIGGALNSIGTLGLILAGADERADGMKVWIKSGTYAISSTTANVSAGRITFPANICMRVEGYQTTRGDRGTPPIFDPSVDNFLIITSSSSAFDGSIEFINLKADGTGQVGVTFISDTTGLGTCICYKCIALSCLGTGFTGIGTTCIQCRSEDCSVGYQVYRALFCIAKDCLTTGFRENSSSSTMCYGCIGFGEASGFEATNATATWIHCTAYDVDDDGFNWNSGGQCIAINCIAYACKTVAGGTPYGFSNRTERDHLVLNCAGGDNEGGNVRTSNMFLLDTVINLTADPFVDGPNEDFRLNDDAGGGALCKGTAFQVPGQLGLPDIGAIQGSSGGAAGILEGLHTIEMGILG